MVGKNVGFSGTHRTSYTQKNLMYILTRAELLFTLCYEIPCVAEKFLHCKFFLIFATFWKTGLVKIRFGAPDNDMMLVAVIKTNYGVIYKISGM